MKYADRIIGSFVDGLNHNVCYDIDDTIIHAIIYYSAAIFVFLLPLKTLSTKLEGENFQACYAYPLIIKALEEVKKMLLSLVFIVH